jgi:hypothetical protein
LDDPLQHRRKGRGGHHEAHLPHEIGIGGHGRHLLLPEIQQTPGQVLE